MPLTTITVNAEHCQVHLKGRSKDLNVLVEIQHI